MGSPGPGFVGMEWDSTKVFHRALPHKTVEHPGARPIVASSAALHEVKRPNVIGRDGWEWEATSDREIPPKNLGKRPGRKPAFEMKTHWRFSVSHCC